MFAMFSFLVLSSCLHTRDFGDNDDDDDDIQIYDRRYYQLLFIFNCADNLLFCRIILTRIDAAAVEFFGGKSTVKTRTDKFSFIITRTMQHTSFTKSFGYHNTEITTNFFVFISSTYNNPFSLQCVAAQKQFENKKRRRKTKKLHENI